MKNPSKCSSEELAEIYENWEPEPIYLQEDLHDRHGVLPDRWGAVCFTTPWTKLLEHTPESLQQLHLATDVKVDSLFDCRTPITTEQLINWLESPR